MQTDKGGTLMYLKTLFWRTVHGCDLKGGDEAHLEGCRHPWTSGPPGSGVLRAWGQRLSFPCVWLGLLVPLLCAHLRDSESRVREWKRKNEEAGTQTSLRGANNGHGPKPNRWHTLWHEQSGGGAVTEAKAPPPALMCDGLTESSYCWFVCSKREREKRERESECV